MHHDVVHVPQVDVRQITGQYALNFSVNLLAFLLVHGPAALFDQAVYLRIGVVSPIGTFGREAGGVKGVFEDIGVLIAVAYPTQRIKLKCASEDVGIERGKLKAADVQGNTNSSQLLLQDSGDQARGLLS